MLADGRAARDSSVRFQIAGDAISPPTNQRDERLVLVRDCSLILAPRPTCIDVALASMPAIREQPTRNSGAG